MARGVAAALPLSAGVKYNLQRLVGELPPAGTKFDPETGLVTMKKPGQQEMWTKLGQRPVPTPVGTETVIGGPKIGTFVPAMQGAPDMVTIDRHMAQLIFDVDTPSLPQIEEGMRLVTIVANELGWTPKQTQAALWGFNMVRKGTREANDIPTYEKVLRARSAEIEDFVNAFNPRGTRGSLPPGRDFDATPLESDYSLQLGPGKNPSAALDELLRIR